MARHGEPGSSEPFDSPCKPLPLGNPIPVNILRSPRRGCSDSEPAHGIWDDHLEAAPVGDWKALVEAGLPQGRRHASASVQRAAAIDGGANDRIDGHRLSALSLAEDFRSRDLSRCDRTPAATVRASGTVFRGRWSGSGKTVSKSARPGRKARGAPTRIPQRWMRFNPPDDPGRRRRAPYQSALSSGETQSK